MASIISAGTTSGTALNMAGDTSGVLQLATNGSTTALTIDASQNVGIGITSPTVKADIVGISGATRGMVLRAASDNGAYLQLTDVGSHEWYVGTPNGTNALVFGDSRNTASDGTERMRINSDGAVCINSTSPTASDNRLAITYSSATQSAASIKNTSTTFNGNMWSFYNSSNVICGAITQSGTTTTAFTTSSDYRLKENIAPMTGALDTVAQLKPVTYTWKEDGSAGQGFIAHELQEIVPDCVIGEKDAVDADGNPQYQGIDTSFLVATLTAAIQEQQTIINDLKARITALEGAA
jgi:hypothetical protein